MNRHTPSALRQTAQHWLAAGHSAIVIEVVQIKGSTPRNVGARMLVSTQNSCGTIGGGHLEWRAMALARQALAECLPGSGGTGVHRGGLQRKRRRGKKTLPWARPWVSAAAAP